MARSNVTGMLAIAVVTFFTLGKAQPAVAEGLRPLEEAIQQEQSPTMLVYVLKRCSAAYGAAAQRMLSSGRKDVAELADTQQNTGTKFLIMAIRLSAKSGLTQDQDSILADIVKLSKLYGEIMDESYLLTGNSFSDQFQADVLLCKSILQGASGNVE